MEDEGLSQSQLAKKLKISRVRVNQILKLPPEKQDYILNYGKEEQITERNLQKVLADEKSVWSLYGSFALNMENIA